MAYTKVKPLMVGSFPSSRLTGAFGAISGANLTGLGDGVDTKSASSDPAINTNPSAVGHVWLNKTSGEMFVCTDATTNANVWINVGGGSGDVEPFHGTGKVSGYTHGGWGGPGNLYNVLDKYSFTADANATDVGDLTTGRYSTAPQASSTHGYSSGGYTETATIKI